MCEWALDGVKSEVPLWGLFSAALRWWALKFEGLLVSEISFSIYSVIIQFCNQLSTKQERLHWCYRVKYKCFQSWWCEVWRWTKGRTEAGKDKGRDVNTADWKKDKNISLKRDLGIPIMLSGLQTQPGSKRMWVRFRALLSWLRIWR